MSSILSYHDLHITTAGISRRSIFDLPYGLQVTCTRVSGWQLWRYPDSGLAGEYDGPWLVLDVNGHTIVDTREPEPAGEGPS